MNPAWTPCFFGESELGKKSLLYAGAGVGSNSYFMPEPHIMIHSSKRIPTPTPQQWRSRTQAIEAELNGLSISELLSGERIGRSSQVGAGDDRRHGYDPTQPRVPAGHPDGGQWTSEGRGGAVDSRSVTFGVGAVDRAEEYSDLTKLRAQRVASQVIADYSGAFTGISRIDKTTLALGQILERTMQTMSFIPTWTPPVYGTAVHVAFGTAVRLAGLEGIGPLDVEHSFIRGGSADYGERGSIRTDVVLRNEVGTVIAIYDLKTGGAKLTPTRVRELRRKTGAGPNVPIIELRVGTARLADHNGENVIGTITAELGNGAFQSSWDQGAFS